ncbi:MAG: UDP-3-O-(3-hydroxymyristoyl)glucosamine N-acyltransferase [Xanthomonadales bacterium]|jgi:UDP-3-O-[3-hydroxymyristoyl] glucosamine N-acyltransferase|nr:UDP-3-O-(3-hydroxymyristoyl)glucosamine N-acyltransferase [Xanthomonadales bacterium]
MTVAKSKHSLSDLSARFGLELRGDGELLIDGVATLMNGGPGQVSFLANRAYRKELPNTKNGAVILREEDAAQSPTNCLVAKDPYLAFARVAALFDPRPGGTPGIHPSAVVSETASLGEGVSIGANAVIGDGCQIGNGCTIGPGTVLEPDCVLDEACRLYANVSVGFAVRMGKRVIVHPGAVIGADGFGIAFAGDHWEKVPQLGTVLIGDDCEIGGNTCIDRGAIGDTVLEEDVRLDNFCQIAHNVHVGAHTAMAGHAGAAGSTTVGKYCMLGGHAGIAGHLKIADRTTIASGCVVYRDITEPGTTWSAQLKAQPIRQWQRIFARLLRIEELSKKVRKLEKQMGKITQNE